MQGCQCTSFQNLWKGHYHSPIFSPRGGFLWPDKSMSGFLCVVLVICSLSLIALSITFTHVFVQLSLSDLAQEGRNHADLFHHCPGNLWQSRQCEYEETMFRTQKSRLQDSEQERVGRAADAYFKKLKWIVHSCAQIPCSPSPVTWGRTTCCCQDVTVENRAAQNMAVHVSL